MISKMDEEPREIEIKLRFDSADAARARLEQLGVRLRDSRVFEDNILYDRVHDPLTTTGRALRLRRVGPLTLLTYKGPVSGEQRYKVRIENETEVANAAATERILTALGFEPVYRYQKFRSVFELEGLEICLDETPLGCFVELEGQPDAIDRAAARLGFESEDYVRESYRELHERAAKARGEEATALLLSVDEAGDPQ
jgi:adenylate cyclase class 2